MTNRARLGLIAVAAVAAVAAFVVLRPDDSDDKGSESGSSAGQTTAEKGNAANGKSPRATAPSAPPPPPERIALSGGAPQGGVKRIVVGKGDEVRLVVSSDSADEIHLHGYDIERTAAPGKPARFKFDADVEGVFEVESHTAEDAGKEPLIARLVVQPS